MSGALRLGLALSGQHPPGDPQAARFAEHVEQVRLARVVGFESVWAGQHYMAAPFSYFQPIPTLARVAAEAEGMRLGTGVILLPLHRPVDIAEQIATLDVITGGRVVFGAGLGYRDDENLAMGIDPRERVGRLEEGLAVLERLWSGEAVSFEGRHFRLTGVRISMPTLQRPRPPIWLAANADGGIRRAARLADAWLMNPHATDATLERQLALFRETRRALGRPAPLEVPLIKECCLAADRATAVATACPFLEEKYRAYRQWEQDKALPPGESLALDFEVLARDRFLVGDPERVADDIARLREKLGITTLIVRAQWPGMAQDAVLRTIRLLGERVLSRLG
ncbi:MAG TPA: LLM class flavin-dependent oxidoreductase [Methylomirabilota bacterium]|nr:LLM class flavin-dependent oxidoreductase [Methylomirabilota bacterium]